MCRTYTSWTENDLIKQASLDLPFPSVKNHITRTYDGRNVLKHRAQPEKRFATSSLEARTSYNNAARKIRENPESKYTSE